MVNKIIQNFIFVKLKFKYIYIYKLYTYNSSNIVNCSIDSGMAPLNWLSFKYLLYFFLNKKFQLE